MLSSRLERVQVTHKVVEQYFLGMRNRVVHVGNAACRNKPVRFLVQNQLPARRLRKILSQKLKGVIHYLRMRTRRAVVNNRYLVPLPNKIFGHVAENKPQAAGDEYFLFHAFLKYSSETNVFCIHSFVRSKPSSKSTEGLYPNTFLAFEMSKDSR